MAPWTQAILGRDKRRKQYYTNEGAPFSTAGATQKGGASYAPQELLEEALKLLATDKARFSNTNYVPYRGATTAPMSSLTQRARHLEEQYGRKGLPYSGKLQNILSRSPEGLPLEDIGNRLHSSQTQFANQSALEALRNQFGAYYTPQRTARFQRKSGKDIDLGTRESTAKLANLDQAVRTLNETRNREFGKTLGVLQDEKQARRNALIGNLQEFGNQKHTHANLVNDANRKAFEQEEREPYRRMQLLEEALTPYQNMINNGIHPDLEKSVTSNIAQALRAYGVNPSQPSSTWSTQRSSGNYPGKLVADMPAEMQLSHNLLERINPKLSDNYTGRRKDIVRQLMNAPSLGRTTAENVHPLVQTQMELLDRQAKDKLKKDLGVLNAKYTQLGQYNSPQHIGEAEVRAREINKSALEARHNLMEDALRRRAGLEHQSTAGNLENLQTLARQGLKDYSAVLQDVRGLNKLGATKWRNEQDELEDLYKNYQNERMWEWPHMRNATRREAHGEIFGRASNRGVSLDELANLKSQYSELEKERNLLNQDVSRLRGDITTKDQYYNTKLAEMSQLEQARVERERALAQQQAAEAARRQQQAADAKRLADQRAAEERERARLAELQRLSTPNMKEWEDFQHSLRTFNAKPDVHGYYHSPRLMHYNYTLGLNRYDPNDPTHLHYGDPRNNTMLGHGYLTGSMLGQLKNITQPQFLQSYKHENTRWLPRDSNIWRK